MPGNYYNHKRADSADTKPGYSALAYLAPKSWFTLIGEPVAASVGAAAATIVADHTFGLVPVGAGFIELMALPKSVEAPGSTNGEIGALNMNWMPKLFLSGDSAALQVMVDTLKNDDLILLVKDIKCPTGKLIQFGCDCAPANISKVEYQSGKRGDGNKGYAIELEATCRFFYEGTVDVFVP